MDKKLRMQNQSIHTFGRPSIDIEKNYKVMALRILRGFSDRDLSFLLGFRPLYVRDVENPLHKLLYKARDTNYLRHIFDCSLDQIMSVKLSELSYDLHVLATLNADGTNSYEIFKKDIYGKDFLLHSFTELGRDVQIAPKCITSISNVQSYISCLLDNDYFLIPRTGLEIFKKCTEHFNGHIKPVFIEIAIKNNNKFNSKKIAIGKNEMRRFVYSKA